MILYSAATVGGVWTIGFNGISQALFLSRLPASDVPFTFILPAAAILVILASYARLASHFSLSALTAGSSIVLLLLALVFRLLLATPYGGSFAVLAGIYLYCEAVSSLVLVQFWTFAGQMFNSRQARRLYGLIAAGGTVSSVAAGFLLAWLVRYIGVDNLLFVVAGSLGVCAACAITLRSYLPSSAPLSREIARDGSDTTGLEPLGGWVEIWRSPLLRIIAGLTILVSLLINIGAYQFFLALQNNYAGRSASLAAYLGGFAIWTGVAALAVQLLGTGPLMMRYGIFVSQALFPLAMAGAGGLTLLSWGPLWAVSLTRACDPTLRQTVHSASLNALYIPVPAEQRRRGKTVLEALYAVTFGLAGVVFLLAQHAVPSWTYQYWSVPVIVLAVTWIVLLIRARPQYASSLSRSVNTRRLDFGPMTLDIADEATVEILAKALHGTDERAIVHVLSIIADAPGAVWNSYVSPLLSHSSAEVRVMALRCLAGDGEPGSSETIAPMLHAPEDEVRGAAIEALCAVLGPDAIERIAPFLGDSSRASAGAAVIGMLRYGDTDQQLRAAKRLEAMAADASPDMRREACRILGALAASVLDPATLSLLAGSEPPALIPAEQMDGAVVSRVIGMLGDRNVRDVAADGLIRCGFGVVPALGAVLDDYGVDPAVRARIAQIMQRIGGKLATQMLMDHIAEPDDMVAGAIFRALAHIRTNDPRISIDEPMVDARLAAELLDCYRFHVWREDLSGGSEDPLLEDALRVRIDRALERIFWLLEARFPRHRLNRARHVLAAADGNAKASEVELLDSLLDRRMSKLLVPLIEAPERQIVRIAEGQLGIARCSSTERLAEVAENGDPWLQACAIFRAGILLDPELTPAVEAGLASKNALVRETALVAGRRLLDPAELAYLLEGEATSTAFLEEADFSGRQPRRGGAA